jgi:hypothetical protein
MFDGSYAVWRDGDHKSKFWARVYMNGRVDWVQGGFRSSRKAQTAAKDRLATYY